MTLRPYMYATESTFWWIWGIKFILGAIFGWIQGLECRLISKLAKNGSKVAFSGRKWAKLSFFWTKIKKGQNGANLRETIAQNTSIMHGLRLCTPGRPRTREANFLQKMVEIAHFSPKKGPFWAIFGPIFWSFLAGLDQIWYLGPLIWREIG